MGVFDIKSTFQSGLFAEDVALAYDLPFRPTFWDDTFSLSLKNAVQHDYGLGSVIRDLRTPRGIPQPNPVESALASNPMTAGLVAGYEAARPFIGAPTTGTPMTKEAYEGSPFYRKEVPWDASMTTDRAAALADQFDEGRVAQYWGEKRPLTALGAEFIGGAADPINYLPIFDEASLTAAGVRIGSFAAHLLSGSASAALSTAAFGALTANTRKQYGDDVSFQGILNEVAMSALIGGAFGAGMYGIARGLGSAGNAIAKAQLQRVIDRTAGKLSTINNTAEARALVEVAADMVMRKGEVDLPEAAKASLNKVLAEARDATAPERELLTQTAGIVGEDASHTISTPGGFKVAAHPEIVDLRTLTPAEGALQVRDRSRFASDMWVAENAARLDPEQLMPSGTAVTGAPLVGPDGIIDSGNGRTKLILAASQVAPDKYAAYVDRLRRAGYEVPEAKNGEVFGLVMRRDTELSADARATFNADANAPIGAVMSPAELARLDANALGDHAFDLIDTNAALDSGVNKPFVRQFLDNLPPTARGPLLDRDGNLNAYGKQRIENALVSAAYGSVDPRVVERFSEGSDDNSRSIVGAMADVAPKWARMARMFKNQALDAEWDVTRELTQALEAITGWRNQAAREKRPVHQVIKEGLGQLDLIAGMSPEAKAMVQAFFTDESYRTAIGRDKIAKLLDRIVENTISLGRPQLFGRPGVDKLEIIQSASDTGQRDSFAPASALGFPEGDQPAAPQGSGEPGGQATGAAPSAGTGQAGEAGTPSRFVGGVSIQQSVETQGIDFVPTDRDMAKVEGELIQTAKKGGKAQIKAMSTEGRYGGVERSVDLEVRAEPGYDPAPLWNKMLEVGKRANQDSVFLAREVDGDEIDPLKHRPGIELNFGKPVPRDQLDAQLQTLKEHGVEFLTVTVGGKPKKSGGMGDATGVRILYMPEFDRRYGFGDDLTQLDDAGLQTHMLGKASEMADLVAQIAANIDGITGRVAWFDADVAFSHEYAGEQSGQNLGTGTSGENGGQAGGQVWAGQSVREGLAAADRQLQFAEQQAEAVRRRNDAEAQRAAIDAEHDHRVIREANADELLSLAEKGDIRGLLESPALQRVTQIMNDRPETHKVEGFGSEDWIGERKYVTADGQELSGVHEAVDYLTDGARTLAARELGIDPFPVKQERKAVVVIGPPAAGKSTIANQIAMRMQAAIPDADEAKKIMPEYDDGIGASATHEESGYLAEIVTERLMIEGDNLVIPKVGGKAASINRLSDTLKKMGYTVDVVLMDVPPQEAFRRMIGRYVRTGRLIPPHYFDEVARAPAQVFEELKGARNQDGYAKVRSDRDVLPRIVEGEIGPAGFRLGDEIPIGAGGRIGNDARGGSGPNTAGALDTLPETVNPIKPPVEPEPPEVKEAAARVGKPDTIAEVAELAGVDPNTGEFPELQDIEQIAFEGRLTAEDRAVMDQAKQDYENAGAYAKALDAAVSCVI